MEGRMKDNKVNIWHWNVNGMNAVLTKGSLQHLLDSADPDILCFNEIKIDEDRLKTLGVKNYVPQRY
jgi:exonuclease III